MSGRFDGLTDAQWKLLEPLLPKDPLKKPKGKPQLPGEMFVIACFGY